MSVHGAACGKGSRGVAVVLAVVLIAAGAGPRAARAAEQAVPLGRVLEAGVERSTTGAPATPGSVGALAEWLPLEAPFEAVDDPRDVVSKLTGSLSVGASAVSTDTSLVYVVDVSGSTLNGGGCGGDANRDGRANTVLDCQVAAILALEQRAPEGITEVGAVVFAATAVAADLSPAAGVQSLVSPHADLDASGSPDIDDALASAYSRSFGGAVGLRAFSSRPVINTATHFAAALVSTCDLVASASGTDVVAVFLSDGENNIGDAVADHLPCDRPAVFHTFAVGPAVRCASGTARGGLQSIAELTGGSCTDVTDPSRLPELVERAIVPHLLRRLEVPWDLNLRRALHDSLATA